MPENQTHPIRPTRHMVEPILQVYPSRGLPIPSRGLQPARRYEHGQHRHLQTTTDPRASHPEPRASARAMPRTPENVRNPDRPPSRGRQPTDPTRTWRSLRAQKTSNRGHNPTDTTQTARSPEGAKVNSRGRKPTDDTQSNQSPEGAKENARSDHVSETRNTPTGYKPVPQDSTGHKPVPQDSTAYKPVPHNTITMTQ
jgi:hypothetical protein